MMRILFIAAAVLAVGALFFPGNESTALRYRVTAKMLMDGKLYEGSTIRETSFTDTPNSITGFGMSVTDKGEAIAVDMGPGKNAVYVLLNGPSGGKQFPFIVMRCFDANSAEDPNWLTAMRNIPDRQKCTLTSDRLDRIMPLIVAFRNEAVPKSIFEVTPESFRKAFGSEARFVELTLERMPKEAPIDCTIDAHLPWLNDIPFDGTNVRNLDPHPRRGLAARDATLAQKVADYYFRDSPPHILIPGARPPCW